jgi:hypothetical protein
MPRFLAGQTVNRQGKTLGKPPETPAGCKLVQRANDYRASLEVEIATISPAIGFPPRDLAPDTVQQQKPRKTVRLRFTIVTTEPFVEPITKP